MAASRIMFASTPWAALAIFVFSACTTAPSESGCGAGAVACGGTCTTLTEDNLNCGACGIACGSSQRCTGGLCIGTCPANSMTCGTRCAQVSVDPENCGTCGRACGSGEVCDGGVCRVSCASDHALCTFGATRTCVDLQADNSSCGSCGTACSIHQKCQAGSCVEVSQDGMTMCNGAWIDTRNSPTNCGSCGNACLGDDRCILSRCRADSKVVFLSSAKQGGKLGGVVGADALCDSLAKPAGLQGSFAAWVSTALSSAGSRITHATVPYRLPGGTVVANDWSGLASSPLLHAIDETETGAKVPDDCTGCGIMVATNTSPSGTTTHPDHDCYGWTENAGPLASGNVRAISGGWWTQYGWGGGCETPLPIYCFEK